MGTSRPKKVKIEIYEFFSEHGVKSVAASDGKMGCPHEEGEDFPNGEDCPFCPFWAGKQGTNRRDCEGQGKHHRARAAEE